ncbi:hypothetical protein T484DRAFT_1789561, partial [Baffinella frigidus]
SADTVETSNTAPNFIPVLSGWASEATDGGDGPSPRGSSPERSRRSVGNSGRARSAGGSNGTAADSAESGIETPTRRSAGSYGTGGDSMGTTARGSGSQLLGSPSGRRGSVQAGDGSAGVLSRKASNAESEVWGRISSSDGRASDGSARRRTISQEVGHEVRPRANLPPSGAAGAGLVVASKEAPALAFGAGAHEARRGGAMAQRASEANNGAKGEQGLRAESGWAHADADREVAAVNVRKLQGGGCG